MFMKNLMLLGLLTFITFAYAKGPVASESLAEAENFKVEKAVKEKSAERSFAGGKAKRELHSDEASLEEQTTDDADSEVRYWQYSE